MTVIESNVVESISLYFQAGNSDKVYHASIEETDGKYVVNFSYGRRGSALKSGTKTNSPVYLEDAKLIYNKLVNEKTKKGYVPKEGEGQILVEKKKDIVESKCVLLNPIEEDHAISLCDDPNWIAQEKMDGVRFMLHKHEKGVTSYNRKGDYVNIPVEIYNTIKENENHFLLDGELVSNTLYAFDILEVNGSDYRTKPFKERFKELKNLIENINSEFFVLTKTANKNKNKFLESLQNNNKEGIVFKNKNAQYYVGRPASGGDYLKFKFYSTCSCIVKEQNESKRSVYLQLFKNKKPVPAGKVTIPINFEIPQPGQIVEVRYLYAMKQSGSLYQPVYLGVREDIDKSDCTQAQLKFKSEDD